MKTRQGQKAGCFCHCLVFIVLKAKQLYSRNGIVEEASQSSDWKCNKCTRFFRSIPVLFMINAVN